MAVQPSPDKIVDATLRNISIAKPQKGIEAETSKKSDVSSINNLEDIAHISNEAASITAFMQEPLNSKTQKSGKNLDSYFENKNSDHGIFGSSSYDKSDFDKFKNAASLLETGKNTNMSQDDIKELKKNIEHLIEAEDPYNNASDNDSNGMRRSAYKDNVSEILKKYNMSPSDVLKQANTKEAEKTVTNNLPQLQSNAQTLSGKTNSTGNINVESKNSDYENTEIYNDQFGKTHEKKTMFSQDGDPEYTSKKNYYNDNISTDTHIENAQTAVIDGTENEKREEAVASPGEKLKVEADVNKEDENKIDVEGKAHKFESLEVSNGNGDLAQQVRLQSEGAQEQTVISTSIENEEGKIKTDIQDIDANKNMKSVVTKNGDSVTITSSNGDVQSSVTIPENDGFFEKAGKGFSNLLFGRQESSYNANGNIQVFSKNGNTDIVTQNGVIHAGDEDDSYLEQIGRGADYVKDSAWSGIKSAWGWTKSWFADPSSK